MMTQKELLDKKCVLPTTARINVVAVAGQLLDAIRRPLRWLVAIDNLHLSISRVWLSAAVIQYTNVYSNQPLGGNRLAPFRALHLSLPTNLT